MKQAILAGLFSATSGLKIILIHKIIPRPQKRNPSVVSIPGCWGFMKGPIELTMKPVEKAGSIHIRKVHHLVPQVPKIIRQRQRSHPSSNPSSSHPPPFPGSHQLIHQLFNSSTVYQWSSKVPLSGLKRNTRRPERSPCARSLFLMLAKPTSSAKAFNTSTAESFSTMGTAR